MQTRVHAATQQKVCAVGENDEKTFHPAGSVDAVRSADLAWRGLKQVRSGRLTRPLPNGGSFCRFGGGTGLSGCPQVAGADGGSWTWNHGYH